MGSETSSYGKSPIQTGSTPSRGRADGTLVIKGKAFDCYMEDFKLLYGLVDTRFVRLNKMIHEPTGHIITVQILDVSSTNERKMLLNTMNGFVVRIVDWSYIATIYGVMAKKEKVWICMEPMRATVWELFEKRDGGEIPEEVLREMTIVVLRALNDDQNLSIPHEGVWPSNILVDDKANFKFCFVPDTRHHGFFDVQTEKHILRLGILLIGLATGKYQMTLPADVPCSDEFRDFVAQCGSPSDYYERPSYALFLEHAFIKQSNEQSRFDSKRWVTSFLQELEQDREIPVIPPEITVRGRLALEAYKKALDEGKTCDKRVPVMLIGQDRSGKTSLKKSLRGEPFNPDEESTLGIDVDPSHFKLSTEIWKIGKKEQERNSETSISYEYHAARATVENLKKEKKGPSPEEGVPETKQSGSIPVVDQVATPVSLPTTVRQDVRSDEMSNDPQSVLDSRHPEQDDSIPKDVETEIVQRLKNEGKVEDEDVHSVLWDFAGQSVYYTTHPLFLTSRGIYLLVNDLSQNPHEKAKPVVKQGMYRKLLDSFSLKTNFDYLDFWMSSIASLASHEESDQESAESMVLPEKLPAVFLVCTHADTLRERKSDASTIARELFGSLQTKPYKIHLCDVFVVDNTMSGHGSECPEVVRLRQRVLAVSKALPQMKEAIPIKWLKYEKDLQAMKEDGTKWIGRDAAKTIASEACDIIDDQEFQTLLNFLHDRRILIHFSDTAELDKLVVLDPQWLIDVFKEVITVRPYNIEEMKFKALWDKLEKNGILDEKLLERVWAPLLDHKETFESLIAMMEKFSLVCSWPSSDASCSKQYLVPSMLMSHPPEDIMSLVESARIPPLFLKFESGQVPPGLFPRLVLQLFQWDQEGQGKPQLYHNFARFYTSQNEDCSVILLCHSSSIEVVVHQETSQELADSLQSKLSCSADASYDTCEVACARAVRRQLGLILESIRNEFCWLKNMKYEVSFICPVCCQEGALKFCRIHATQGCKLEECLHFWSESQLCNVKVNRCDKLAAARSNRVAVKQFEPWFAPQKNQMAFDKDNGGTLANMEESKAIALPCEVQECLLCQTSDAREVVRQLQVTLQLDQASLQKPGLETTQMIRYLARTAKDLNRLDVFEHLREITPAGTCGPRMSEHLDVRNVPVSKIRDLTVDLCGGEEWKLVAEALGLTPQEIRFLDHRTLNPLDSALAFIAKQRHITVGELYDKLSECGYPAIADLRL